MNDILIPNKLIRTTNLNIGVVRGYENLGDRIIAKNMKAKDGNKYGVGRYVAVSNSTKTMFYTILIFYVLNT